MTDNHNQPSPLCQLLGVLFIGLVLGLLLVPLDAIESVADTSTLTLFQLLDDLDLPLNIPEKLLVLPQDLRDTLESQLNIFLAERMLVSVYIERIGLLLIIQSSLVLLLALPAFITGALFAQLQCRIDAAHFGLGSLPWRYFMKNCLLAGFLFLLGLLIAGFLLQEFLPLSPMKFFNLLVLCTSIWTFFFGAFLVNARWHRQR